MITEHTGPFGPQSHSQALQRTTTNITSRTGDMHISEIPSITYPDNQDEPLLVHFNGHFNGELNGTFILPSTIYKKSQGESDAQIAARRAMARRNSRSFVGRISRTKSRKKEMFGRPTKPGITLDTSFSRHRGDEPRQLYPHETESKSSGGTIRKHTWLGLGRQSTKNKGLGITRGTPQPEKQSDTTRAPPNTLPFGISTFGEQSDGTENLDPNTATPGSKTWQEVSPWDRAIPIGISIPSDSVTDFSPYESTRHRSASDATLVTPSIIITPANAMKSVWSPDTASDYTASIYSRTTFNFRQDNADIPPVPALPVDTKTTSTSGFNIETQRGLTEGHQSRSRNDTLDSAGTAFEDDEENDFQQRERIISTATFFEEDETPLRNKNMLSTLSIDTDVTPTPRRSQGWWNIITTPFAVSRTNSVWTQGGRNMEKTPTVPVMPQRFGLNSASPSTPTTYIWSATEKSPSIRGNSPLVPTSITMEENRQSEHVIYGFKAQTPPTARSHDGANTIDMPFVPGTLAGVRTDMGYESRQAPSTPDRNIVSPLSAMSPSPIVNTATTGTVMMPRQVQGAQPIHFVIELQDRRTDANGRATFTNTQAQPPIHENIEYHGRQTDASAQAANTNTPYQSKFEGHTGIQPVQSNATLQERSMDTPATGQSLHSAGEIQGTSWGLEIQATKTHTPPMRQPIYTNIGLPNNPRDVGTQVKGTSTPPVGQPAHASALTPHLVNVRLSTPGSNRTQQELPVFAPPPTSAQNSSHFSYGYGSRVNSPVSTPDLKGQKQKQHRKISTMMDCVPFLRRFQKNKADHEMKDQERKKKKKKGRKGGWCFWCCGCCIIILVLLAIIIPVTVVVTKKHNNDSKVQDPPSQWVNLTDYPAIPLGFSTIAQPEASVEQSGCVVPATIWSCALPKEQQQSISPNKPDQPNFRLKITFENGTVVDPTKTLGTKRAVNPASAGAFIRSRILAARAPPSASPAPPSIQDQKFLGENTDGNLAPFEGEDTPFFITFEEPQSTTSSRLAKRAGTNNTSNITSVIPPPDVNTDGTAKPANLYPLPSAQPLRLYNREKADEHYGFFIYYDRSIFLKSTESDTGRGGNPADVDGGSPFDAATKRCTFSQTRFLVQIWTKSKGSKVLLQGSASNSSTAFKRPGSFPYPVTVTLDRHGGDPTKKNVYCYSVETDGTIKNIDTSRSFIFEDRKFGGNLVNGTQGLNVTTGPIDGGTGGCSCQWQNWITT
jgi:hypothetical protein